MVAPGENPDCHMSFKSSAGLESLIKDFNIKSVLEYGGGKSTFFFSNRVEVVYTVEHVPAWVKRAKNVTHILTWGKPVQVEEYVKLAPSFRHFDLVLVDGIYRDECFNYMLEQDWWKILCVHDWGDGQRRGWYTKYVPREFDVRGYDSLKCYIRR